MTPDDTLCPDATERRDRFLSPEWRPAHDRVQNIVDSVKADIEVSESRTRRRQPSHQKQFETSLTALVCAVLEHSLFGDDQWLYTTRSNTQLEASRRYRPAAYSSNFTKLQDQLAERGWIELHIAKATNQRGAPATQIKAGPRLLALIEDRTFYYEDFLLLPRNELIELRSAKDYVSEEFELIDYPETDQTKAMRSEMERINHALAQADISSYDERIDTRRRSVYRVFNNGSFSSGGRLFGGFWQSCEKKLRLETIEIDGEPVVELDFNQMSLAYAYGKEGLPLPQGDLYDIDFRVEIEGSPRPTVKAFVNAMFNRKTPLEVYLDDMEKLWFWSGGKLREYPAWWLRWAILEKHAPISGWFESGKCLDFMFTESQIAKDVLLDLITQGEVGLPIHDAFLVKVSIADEAETIMRRVFIDHVGGEVGVSRTYPSLHSKYLKAS